MKPIVNISLYHGPDVITVNLDRYHKANKGRRTKRGMKRSPRKEEPNIHGLKKEDFQSHFLEETEEQ